MGPTRFDDAATIVAAPQQVSTQNDDEIVILDPASGRYYSLEGVGAYIWSLIQEPRPVAEIRAAIEREYEAPSDRIARDLQNILSDLRDAGLVEVDRAADR